MQYVKKEVCIVFLQCGLVRVVCVCMMHHERYKILYRIDAMLHLQGDGAESGVGDANNRQDRGQKGGRGTF